MAVSKDYDSKSVLFAYKQKKELDPTIVVLETSLDTWNTLHLAY